MANPLVEPFTRLIGRWRMKRAVAHLDPRLLEDAGFRITRSPWTDALIDKQGYWIRRRNK